MNRLFNGVLGLLLIFPLLVSAAETDIPLKDFSGNKRNVNEFVGKGKWVILTIWASDCHICNQEIHHMAFFHNDHHNKDAIVLGVSIDGQERIKQARSFIDRHSLNFTNLLAEPEDLSHFPAPFYGTPTYYIYTPTGEVASWQVGAVTQTQVEKFIEQMNARKKSKDKKG